MPKPQFVSDLRDGTLVASSFAVAATFKPSGNGPFRLTLRDRTGDISAIVWPNATNLTWDELRIARFVDIEGLMAISAYTRQPEVTIRTLKQIDAPVDTIDYLPGTPCDPDEMWNELKELVASLQSRPLRQLMTTLFKDAAFKTAYCTAPAAQQMHHPYIGGLLEHSLEVARLCDAVASALNTVDRDLLVVAALLHDMGKTEEIDYGGPTFGSTRAGGMLGHVFLGTQRVYAAMQSIPDCPDGLADALCHLLLSHHGRGEWGAPVGPCFEEAAVLHACDNLSARSYYYRTARPVGDTLFQPVRGLDDRVYVGAQSWKTRRPEREVRRPLETAASAEPPVLRLVTSDPPAMFFLPVSGDVAAGIPTDAQSAVDERLPVPATNAVHENDFLLRVRGDSMIGAHIQDGDMLVVRPGKDARSGDIVVALVDGESTVKYLIEENGGMLLRAANDRYPDIHPGQELVIQGTVVSVTRGLY